MPQALIVILLVIVILVMFKIGSLKREVAALKNELAEEEKEFAPLAQYNERMTQIRNENKAKAMALFAAQAKVSTGAVAKALAVSEATAFRYLAELEKEGKIIQQGRFGRTVFYRKNG